MGKFQSVDKVVKLSWRGKLDPSGVGSIWEPSGGIAIHRWWCALGGFNITPIVPLL